MDKLKDLLSRCKCGVYVSVNEHRDYYQTAAESIDEMHDPGITEEVKAQMVETDNIVHVQFYPHTPVGSISIYHYDIDLALDEALASFDS